MSRDVHVHKSLNKLAREPSMAKNSSPSRAPKTGSHVGMHGDRKKASIPTKTHLPPPPYEHLVALARSDGTPWRNRPQDPCPPSRGNPQEILPKVSEDCRMTRGQKTCLSNGLVGIMSRFEVKRCEKTITSENGPPDRRQTPTRSASRSCPRSAVEPCLGPPCRRRSAPQNAAGPCSGRRP